MKNIYVVGFMGTGKSTVGKKLSLLLRKKFVEMDDEIEKKEHLKITDIFKQKGEAYFRIREEELLEALSQKEDLVISCGGGTVVNPRNLERMNTSGISICLWAEPSVVLDRVKSSAHRPLLCAERPLLKIQGLLREREPFYKKARFAIDTTKLSPGGVVKELRGILKKTGWV